MSFLAELKQRKVFRVATVYLVVAWLAIQVASIALPTFEAPAWVMRVLILLLALGFPMALLLAWALELTDEGIRLSPGHAGNRRMAAIAAGLVALALGWYFLGQPAFRASDLAGEAAPATASAATRATASAAGEGATKPAAPERSIAVLPFVNMSHDPANEYFSDGLAETTLDMLAQIDDLKVIARTSSFAFKGKRADMREIGRTLGVAHLLEGSVQQSGDTVRITAQLIRVSDGSHVWSKKFDRRKLGDVFAIQDEIASSVVEALQVALAEPEQQRLLRKRTENVAAYQEFLKGMALMPRRQVPEMRRAAQHFEKAIALDPGYAQAYVGARDAYRLLDRYAGVSEEERARGARYLAKALALAPNLGEAHISRATTLENAGDLAGAAKEFQLGLKLAPGYATGHQWYAEYLAFSLGEHQAARKHFDQALRLDPLSPVLRDIRLFAMAQGGQVDEALVLSDELIASMPDVARNYNTRSALHLQKGNLVAALSDMRKHAQLDPGSAGFRSNHCALLTNIGQETEAMACLKPLLARSPDQDDIRIAHTALLSQQGRHDQAIAEARRAPALAGQVQAYLLLSAGRGAEARSLVRGLGGDLLAAPSGVTPARAFDAVLVGASLLGSPDDARARRLLAAAAAAVQDQPYGAVISGQRWLRFVANALLGDKDAAFAALKDGVDSGYYFGLANLDAMPQLADLRADPRYARITAPARARQAREVAAARRAGLL